MNICKTVIILLFNIVFVKAMYAQESETEKKEPPRYSFFRATENYEYLKNKENNPYKADFFDPIKFIPLNNKKDIYLSFGGQIRPRYEHFSNRLWIGTDDLDFYSQRLAIHSDLHLGKHIRVFTELYHGYTSHTRQFIENDEIDFHQAFVEFKIPSKKDNNVSFLLGRQELAYGSARLVGFREGPNIRRTFDVARAIFKSEKTSIQGFYSREVAPTIEAFDNKFTLFDNETSNPKLWGVYSQFKIKGLNGMNEIYYLGYQTPNAFFSDVSGEEKRHSVGIRRFGKLGQRFQYNTEIIYQFGTLGETDISAFNIEGDWSYTLINTTWKPKLGMKLDYTSGDKDLGDDKLNTFNPLFVNPAYYSLASTITPINLISFHPSVRVQPSEKLSVYTEWGVFWRASKNDGLYRPPRFINRSADGISEKSLGNQFGLKASYEFNRHLSFDMNLSYFSAGKFQKESGDSENIFHIAPTLSYKF